MDQRSWVPRMSKLRLGIVAAVISGVVGIVSLPSAQAVEGGDATCDALDVELLAELLGTEIINISGGTDDVNGARS